MLIKCDCKSDFQDKNYGLGIRVANEVAGRQVLKRKADVLFVEKNTMRRNEIYSKKSDS